MLTRSLKPTTLMSGPAVQEVPSKYHVSVRPSPPARSTLFATGSKASPKCDRGAMPDGAAGARGQVAPADNQGSVEPRKPQPPDHAILLVARAQTISGPARAVQA